MRKSFYFSLLVLLLQAGHSSAQSTWIGIKGGLSIPDLSGGGDNPLSKGYTSRLAANFGLLSDFTIHNNFSLQVELNYAGQGGKHNGFQPITNLPPQYAQMIPPGVYPYANFKNKAILDYLELPVMAKLTWGKSFQFYVNAGPYVGYLLHAREKASGTSPIYIDEGAGGQQPVTPPISLDGSPDVTSSINRWNVGVTGGGGIAYPLASRHKIFFDARFEYGFINIQKDPADGKDNTGNVLLSLGYAYRLGKK